MPWALATMEALLTRNVSVSSCRPYLRKSLSTRRPFRSPHAPCRGTSRQVLLQPGPGRPVVCKAFNLFKDMFGKGKQDSEDNQSVPSGSQLSSDEDDGAEMQPIDLESSGGLGGTSEDVFGPLVGLQGQLEL